MSRTTLAIDDALLRDIKRLAAEQGLSMQALINRLLRQSLMQEGNNDYKLDLKTWDAQLQPGIDLLDRDSLLDAMDAIGAAGNFGPREKV